MTRKIVSEMTYNVSMGTLNPTIPRLSTETFHGDGTLFIQRVAYSFFHGRSTVESVYSTCVMRLCINCTDAVLCGSVFMYTYIIN